MVTNPQPWDDNLVREYDRDFLAFSIRHGVYCVPVDEDELDRQQHFYNKVTQLFEGQVFLPGDLKPEDVLDCGSGSGLEWADDVMEKIAASEDSADDDFPCQVTAVDIFHMGTSPEVIKKKWNLNESFRLDHDELTRDKYDLVNSRFLADGINKNRWPSYIQDLYGRLRPGGWLQMVEAELNLQSDSGRTVERLSVTRWWETYSEGLERQNKEPRVGRDLSRNMHNAGFVNIHEAPRRLPVGEWHTDPRLREIGRDMRPIAVQSLRSLGVWPCCHTGGMSKEAFDALIDQCEQEINDPSLRLYIQLYVVWGQKAENGKKRSVDEGTSYVPSPKRRPPPPVDWGQPATQR